MRFYIYSQENWWIYKACKIFSKTEYKMKVYLLSGTPYWDNQKIFLINKYLDFVENAEKLWM